MQTAKFVAIFLLCVCNKSDTTKDIMLIPISEERASFNTSRIAPRTYIRAEMREANGYIKPDFDRSIWDIEINCDCGESSCMCEQIKMWENTFQLTTEDSGRFAWEEGLEEQAYRQHAG
ncbi:hypothetical protein ABG067_000113 [Albugo candida]|uniref:Uncharacterized protein n=1 Tax=Albugo candida TaxID=65357 RepID=A0A024GGF7_9STRA|nr:unnamed protein product [Albugo candida]|eukprot:CCI45849.1 unnamed protein product [Albugo candida]